MSDAEAKLQWSAQFKIVAAPSSLSGDKIVLPSEALEQLLQAIPSSHTGASSTQTSATLDPFNPYSAAARRHAQSQFAAQEQKLPHPLTFRLVNPISNRVVYAGVTEFSAAEGCVALSPFLVQALGLAQSSSDNGDKQEMEAAFMKNSQSITVHYEELSKGTFVKLRPLEAGYDPEDWKALLESHLRANFTTLTRGEVLAIRPSATETFQFLVDEFKPAGNGICVVDTDLEVDIEALNEEQARETMKRYAQKHHLAPGSEQGSSRGGELKLFKAVTGQILPGDYIDYELTSWPRQETVQVSLDVQGDGQQGQLDVLINAFGAYERARPREDEHAFGEFADRPSKRIKLHPSNVELEHADSLYIAVHASPSIGGDKQARQFSVKVEVSSPEPVDGIMKQANPELLKPGPDEALCSNCKHVIPKQSLMLHENFCRRNNIRCPYSPTCEEVFQRNSPALHSHWHCESEGCGASGSSVETHQHHTRIFHAPVRCPSCSYPDEFPSMAILALHRIRQCPGKHILCRFCHLSVPQEGTGDDPFAAPDPEVVLSGMTAHEVADGARTTECHLCSRITRLRDMETHLRNHDFERRTRPTPRVCRNVACGRTLDGANANGDTRSASKVGQGPGNEIGLCSLCFSPLYVTVHDPEGKALKRRVERRYLSQLTAGCGKSWCRNPYCKTGKTAIGNDGASAPTKALSIAEAMPVAKPIVDGLYGGVAGAGETPLHFCTDEANQRRRNLALMLEAEGRAVPTAKQYNWVWCVAALEAHKGDLLKAQEWLKNFAPTTDEEAHRQDQ